MHINYLAQNLNNYIKNLRSIFCVWLLFAFSNPVLAGAAPPALLNATTDSTNASCNNMCNGTATVHASGGIAPYSYTWSPNTSTDSTATGLCAGTYNCTVTDAASNTIAVSIIINQPTPLVGVPDSVIGNACYGDTTGGVYITLSGGTPPYNFTWSNGQTTDDLIHVVSGTYSVTATDANTCSISASGVVVPGPLTPLSLLVDSIKPPSCNNDSNGALRAVATGGTSPYMYTWSNGGNTDLIFNLPAGAYNVSVTDNNGCTVVPVSATLINPPVFNAQVDSTHNALCNGSATGSIYISVSGGISPYNYDWSNNATQQDLLNITPGIYSVIITDSLSCKKTLGPIIISSQNTFSISADSITNIACFNDSTGAIYTHLTGGNAPFTYLWNTGAATGNISHIPSGNYTVSVSDNAGCSATLTEILNNPPALVITLDSLRNANCNGGSDGAVYVTTTGGTGLYSYIWSNSTINEDLAGVTAGMYSVSVADDNGCHNGINSIQVNEPAPWQVTTDSIIQPLCHGDANGKIYISVSGVTPVYSYAWSNGNNTLNLLNVAAGNYTLTITDQHGCQYNTGNIVLNNPAVVSVIIDSSFNANCNGPSTGSVYITPGGGTGNYTYLWSDNSTAQNLLNVAGGSYSVTVTDTHLCSATAGPVTILPSTPVTLVIDSIIPVACYNGTGGKIYTTAGGGAGPYSYLWSNSNTTDDILNLTAGTYSLTVHDANNCSATVTGVVQQPTSALNLLVDSITNVGCYGAATGAVFTTAGGGAAPYQYAWNNVAANDDTTGLTAGVYTCIVTDANQCSVSVSATVNQNTALSASVSQTDVLCNGGSTGTATINISGGTGSYTFNWNPNISNNATASGLVAGIYNVTATDGNGCTLVDTVTINQPDVLAVNVDSVTNLLCAGSNTGAIYTTTTGGTASYTYTWSNGAITGNINGLTAGTFRLTVTDVNACSASTTAVITEPAALSATTTQVDINCSGSSTGSATVNVTGGVGGYTYAWSPMGGPGATATGLTAGSYTCLITDTNGCTYTASVTIAQNNLLNGSSTQTDVLCYGGATGTAGVTASGGTGNYTYTWNPNVGNTPGVTGLQAGTYTVTVSDGANCLLVDTITIAQPAGPLVVVTDNISDALCAGSSTGAIFTTATGGTSPYNYLWSSTDNTDDVSGLPAGVYVLTVTDDNGCTAQLSDTIGDPVALSATSTQTNISCGGSNNGTATVNVSGGTGSYTYAWSPAGGSSTTATGLGAGIYTCLITDGNGCQLSINDTITQVSSTIAITIDSTQNPGCLIHNAGAIYASVIGGTLPYTYLWSNGDTTLFTDSLFAGNYILTVTDNGGCTAQSQVVHISNPNAIFVNVDSVRDVACANDQTGAIWITANGGTGNFTYHWSDNSTTEDLQQVTPGQYQVTVNDAGGCSATSSGTVFGPSPFSISTQVTDNICPGQDSGAVSATISGGTPGYTYMWSNGAQTSVAHNLANGNYSVTVTDAVGCTATTAATVNPQHANPVVYLGADTARCPGNVVLDAQNAGASFLWSDGGTNETLTINNSGVYSVLVTDTNGCYATDTIAVTVFSLPQVSFFAGVDTVCLNSGAVSLTATPSGGVFSGNGVNGNAFDPQTAGLGSQALLYTYTDTNGCSNSAGDTLYVDACLGVEQLNAADIHVYPNPNAGIFYISCNWPETVSCQVVDLLGKVVENRTIIPHIPYITIGGLGAGIYLVRLNVGQQVKTYRVTVVK